MLNMARFKLEQDALSDISLTGQGPLMTSGAPDDVRDP